jgi:ABC-type transport system involved in multi-copper enzyme maturation permease subunit
MIWILIRKEIQESIVDFRFWIATILCLLLIPLGIYVSLKDYEQRLESYQTSNQQYVYHSQGRINADFQAEGYRAPSSLSVFARGLKDLLNLKVTTSRDGNARIESRLDNTSLQAILFGRIDFVYIVSTVLSILAFIFTFSSITGEKEIGTLRLILSNPIPRSDIIIAKIVGAYLVFLVPFTLSLLIGLLVLHTSRFFSLGSVENLPAILVMLTITLLFTLCIFCLGVLISVLSRSSIVSIIVVLLVWVVWALVIPKMGPMIAQIAYPIQSRQVIDGRKRMAQENLQGELKAKVNRLLISTMMGSGILNLKNFTPSSQFKLYVGPDEKKKIKEEFDQKKAVLELEYKKQVDEAIGQIESEYAKKRRIQTSIAMSLSRLSPICCLTYAFSELAGTGTCEIDSFSRKANQFQELVQQEVYSKFQSIDMVLAGQSMNVAGAKEGVDPNDIPVPQLSSYRHTTLGEAMQTCWVDILLLALFSALFFGGAFVRFLKYDAR